MHKVLFIANKAQTGGATNALFNIVKNLKEKYSIEPIILVSCKGNLTQMCEKENINYIILNFKNFAICEGNTKLARLLRKMAIPILKIYYRLCNMMAIRKIGKLLDMNQIDIIHTNVNRDEIGALLSKKYKIPHIWHLREFGDADYKCHFLRRDYIDFMNKNTTYFIAISEAIKDYFIEKGIDKNKIKLIYDGIEINNNFEKHFSKDKLKILFLGTIQASKGQLELIEALNLLPKEVASNIYVDFFGEEVSEYKKLLINKINNYNIKNIKFNNYKSDIQNIIKDYDVGIMCSRSEAFGLVTVEYMSNKLITIVPDKGACLEIMEKECGFMYKYGDYQNLANIIEKIYNMENKEKEQISDNAYKRALNFSSKSNVENVMKLYKQILK